MSLTLALAAVLAQDADWWNAAWSSRRSFALENPRTRAAAKGVRVDVPLKYRALKIKARDDLADLRLVHQGKELPFEIGSVDPEKGEAVLWFRLQDDIPKGFSRRGTGYFLYYGNAAAAAPAYDPAELHAFSVDLRSAEQIAARLRIDPRLRGAPSERGWILQSVDASCTEAAPGEIVLNAPAPGPSQRVTVRFRWEAPEEDKPVGGTIALAAAGAAAAPDAATAERIAALIRDLQSDDQERRIAAQAGLVEQGPPALAQLREATRFPDAEVRLRAQEAIEQILSKAGTGRHALVGIAWKDGETSAFGRWKRNQPPGGPRINGKEAATLVLWHSGRTRGVEVGFDTYVEDLITEMTDRTFEGPPPADFRILVWGDGRHPLPTLRIERITAADEIRPQDRLTPHIDPEERRPGSE